MVVVYSLDGKTVDTLITVEEFLDMPAHDARFTEYVLVSLI